MSESEIKEIHSLCVKSALLAEAMTAKYAKLLEDNKRLRSLLSGHYSDCLIDSVLKH